MNRMIRLRISGGSRRTLGRFGSRGVERCHDLEMRDILAAGETRLRCFRSNLSERRGLNKVQSQLRVLEEEF